MKKLRLPPRRPSKFQRHWRLAPGTIFLNHGSFGACPKAILKLQSDLRRQMEAEPVQFLWRRFEERLDPARRVVAHFVRARPQDLVFVTNATTGLNAVVRSVKLKPGDELLTTNHDYNACHNVLVQAAKDTGARLITARVPFPLRGETEVLEAVLGAATRRTKLALIDQVTSSTAVIFPVEQIVRELERRGIQVVVDGAHAPGMLPIDLGKLKPSYYTANLHKWVCAPKGAGFLWAREDRQAHLQPAVISHGNNTPRPGYSSFQDRFDWAGTLDPTAWFCAAEAIRWMQQTFAGGWPGIMAANHELVVQARRLLCEQLEVAPPCPEDMLAAMATIPLPGKFQGRPKVSKIDPEQRRLYDEFGIEVPFFRIGHAARRFFRISSQLYNSLDQYQRLAEALQA